MSDQNDELETENKLLYECDSKYKKWGKMLQFIVCHMFVQVGYK